jgi:hypothetical protein
MRAGSLSGAGSRPALKILQATGPCYSCETAEKQRPIGDCGGQAPCAHIHLRGHPKTNMDGLGLRALLLSEIRIEWPQF